MTTFPVRKAYGFRRAGRAERPEADPDPHGVLGAVLQDVRQTLRCAWVDPAVEAAARFPVFFTAAWSAIRPNVGRSFLALSRSLRNEAAESLRLTTTVSLRKQVDAMLGEDDLARVEDVVRVLHLASAKYQIVVHALHRAAKRERITGTGSEEPPIRRGVPEGQRWIAGSTPGEQARPILQEAEAALGSPSTPVPLRLLSRWPAALSATWNELRPLLQTDGWRAGSTRLRRIVHTGISSLPHPIELQWTALAMRGFTEEHRERAADVLAAHDRAMPGQTLAAAFTWLALGAPDIGAEG